MTGSVRSLVRATVYRAWLSWRSPDRLSRTRTVWPEEAGIGAAPPSMAKAASERQRPGWDQAHRTVAATIGPTPGRVSRSGRQARTNSRMAWRWAAAWLVSSWIRRAKLRSVTAVLEVSTSCSGLGQLITTQRLAGGPAGIQGIGLGAVPSGGPLGPIQLHDLLVMGG